MRLLFPVSLNNEKFMRTPIDVIFSGNREINVLKRASCFTVGDFVNKYTKEDELLKIKNCGAISRHKIMQGILNYYVSLLEEEEVVSYFMILAALNPGLETLNFKVTE